MISASYNSFSSFISQYQSPRTKLIYSNYINRTFTDLVENRSNEDLHYDCLPKLVRNKLSYSHIMIMSELINSSLRQFSFPSHKTTFNIPSNGIYSIFMKSFEASHSKRRHRCWLHSTQVLETASGFKLSSN